MDAFGSFTEEDQEPAPETEADYAARGMKTRIIRAMGWIPLRKLKRTFPRLLTSLTARPFENST